MRGDGIGCQAVCTPYYYIYSDKHIIACEAKKNSPPNLSEGDSFCLPINIYIAYYTSKSGIWLVIS